MKIERTTRTGRTFKLRLRSTPAFGAWGTCLLLGGMSHHYHQIPPVGGLWCLAAAYLLAGISGGSTDG